MKKTIITCDMCGSEVSEEFSGATIVKKNGIFLAVTVAAHQDRQQLDLCKKCGVDQVSDWLMETRGDLFK